MRDALLLVLLLSLTGCARQGSEVAPVARPTVEPAKPATVVQQPSEPDGGERLRSWPEVRYYQLAVYFEGDLEAKLGAPLRDWKGLEALPHARVPDVLPETPRPAFSIDFPPFQDYPPPPGDRLRYLSLGMTDADVTVLEKADAAVVLTFVESADQKLAQYHAALAVTLQLAKALGGTPWDETTRQVVSPSYWLEERLDWKSTDLPDIRSHITIHYYLSGEHDRMITLGMEKFGLPNLVVQQVVPSAARQTQTLVNIVAQLMLQGLRPDEDGNLRVDLAQLTHEKMRSDALATAAEGATWKGTVQLSVAPRDEGDPPGPLLRIQVPGDRAAGTFVNQQAFLSQYFGATDEINRVDHDQEILAASAAARKKLIAIADEFKPNPSPGTRLLVKAPFRTPDGGNEWMWIHVTGWSGEVIKGALDNEPFSIPGLKAGAVVEVQQGSVFDYILRRADGTTEGNETGKLIEARSSSER